MTSREKRILRYLAIPLGFILLLTLIPKVSNYYHNHRQSIDDLRNQIGRYEMLGKRMEYWQAESQRASQERDKINLSILPGNTRELAIAKMQGLVRELAKNTGITFKSLNPPDTYSTGEWMLVIQSMQFEASGSTLEKFLKAVMNNLVKLEVISLDVRSNKKKLSCTVEIIGFSRVQPLL